VAEVAPGSKLTWSYGQLATKLGGAADSKHPNGKRNTDPPSLRRLFGLRRS